MCVHCVTSLSLPLSHSVSHLIKAAVSFSLFFLLLSNDSRTLCPLCDTFWLTFAFVKKTIDVKCIPHNTTARETTHSDALSSGVTASGKGLQLDTQCYPLYCGQLQLANHTAFDTQQLQQLQQQLKKLIALCLRLSSPFLSLFLIFHALFHRRLTDTSALSHFRGRDSLTHTGSNS